MKVLEGIKLTTKYLEEGITLGPFDLDHSYDLRRIIRYRNLDEDRNITALDVESYDMLKRELINNGAEVEESPAFADVVKTSLATPPWFADIKEKRVVVFLKKKKSRHRLNMYDIPSCEWNHNRNRYEIPLADAWRLDDKAIEFADILDLSVELRAYMLTQGERRAKLDIIAQQDDSDIKLPPMGGIDFRPFQKVAIEFLKVNGYKGLMAYDMGLGKTVIALTAAELLRAEQKDGKIKVLCTVPTAVIPNWKREIKKYCGENTPVYIIEGGSPKSVDTLTKVLTHDDGYFLIGYPSMGSYVKAKARREIKDDGEIIQHEEAVTYMWSSLLNKAGFDLHLADESHFIKNRGSHRSKGVRDLDIKRVIQLSGTPLLNRPGELWPLVAMHDKVLAGPAETFERHFTASNGRTAKNLDELRDTLKTFMLRRTKKDVMKDLPPINRIEIEYNLSDGAWDRYQQVLIGIYTELDGMGNVVREKDVPNILARIMRLKQVCAQDKVDFIADLAIDIYDQTEAEHKKVLTFSQFVNQPPIVPDIAKRLGGEALWFSGKHPPEERQKLVDEFNTQDNIHFLVAGIQAGGTGLNITAAGSVIFVDLMWRPADHLQAEGRAYGRLIDPHCIDSYYINAVKTFGDEVVPTIEMYIQKLIDAKMKVIESVIDGTEASRMDVSIAKEIIQTIIRNRKVLLRGRKK